MFILIPVIIIFLCLSYIQINDDVGASTLVVIYLFMAVTVAISLYLYVKIQKDLHQQELNSIQLEINKLIDKLHITKDEKVIDSISHKIELLQYQMEKLK